MRRAPQLLQLLLTLLAAHGLAREALAPWRSWMLFKQFVRTVDELPDPGVSVQITAPSSDVVRVSLVRQVAYRDDDRLVPVGGVVCQLEFPARSKPAPDIEFWSFDYRTLEAFFDAVAGEIRFQDLVVRAALRSDVFWEDAIDV